MQMEVEAAPGEGDVAPARLSMVRVPGESLGIAGPLHVQHRRGGARALGDLEAHGGWPSAAVGGQIHGLVGGMVVARR